MNASAAPEAAAKTAVRRPSLAERAAAGKPSAAVKRVLPGNRRTVDIAGFSSSI